jgi:hypothetical protein
VSDFAWFWHEFDLEVAMDVEQQQRLRNEDDQQGSRDDRAQTALSAALLLHGPDERPKSQPQ